MLYVVGRMNESCQQKIMAKKKVKKPHPAEAGIIPGSTPVELMRLLIKNKAERAMAVDEIANHGPEHKQVLSALLLKRLYKLVQVLEKATGAEFSPQEGYLVTAQDHDLEVLIPVALPLQTGSKTAKENIIRAVSPAPVHEILVYAICLQAIEWGIKAGKAGI